MEPISIENQSHEKRFEFKYRLTDADYVAFRKYYLFNTPFYKKYLLVLRLLIPIYYVALEMLSYLIGGEFRFTLLHWVVIGILSLIWYFAVNPIVWAYVKFTIRRMGKGGKLPYSRDVLLQFKEDCFIEVTPEIEMKVKYTAIERMVRDQGALYIYIDVSKAFIIPLAAFKTPAQEESFRAFLHEKAPNLL